MSSSKRTSSSTLTFYESSILKKFKNNLFEFLLRLAEKDKWLNKWFCLILEIIGLVQFLLFVSEELFEINEGVANIASYFFLLEDPTHGSWPIEVYIGICIVGFCYVLIGAVICFYLFYTQEGSDFMYNLLAVYLRVSRTVLLFPLMNIMLSPFQCNFFDGSMDLNHYEGQKCIDFPHLIFFILGPIFCVIMFAMCTIDCLFLIDKLKSIHHYTASPDGRFLFTFVTFNVLSVLGFAVFTEETGLCWLSTFLQFLLILILYILVIRFIPFFSKAYTIFFSLVISMALGCALTSCINDFAEVGGVESPWVLVGLTSLLGIIPITILLMVGRYWGMHKLYEKSTDIKFNILFCYTAADVACVVYHTKKDKGRLSETIAGLIKNLKFKKSKIVCHMFISLVLDVSNINLATIISSHSDSILSTSSPDIDFLLFFYKNKISELQYARDPELLKIVKDLRRVRRMEENIDKLYQRLFAQLISDDSKISFNGFPKLMTTIVSAKNYCKSRYNRMLKVFPNKEVFRKYARYLRRYINDRRGSDEFLAEAKNFGDGSDTASHISQTSLGSIGSIGDKSEGNECADGKEMEREYRSPHSVTSHTTGSKISRGSSSFGRSTRSDFRALTKKVVETNYLAIYLTQFSLCLLFFVGIGVIVSVFTLTMVMKTDFESSAVIIEMASDVRLHGIGIAHFFRKMQISQYNESDTILDHERNTSSFRNRLESQCDEILEDVNAIYKGHDDYVWKNTILKLVQDVHNEGDHEHGHHIADAVVHYKNYTLLDAVLTYAEKCHELLELDNEEFGCREEGHMMEENDDFIFVTLNEPILFRGLQGMLDHLIDTEEKHSLQNRTVYIIIPSVLAGMFILFAVLYCVLLYAQKRSFKGFLLIPKEDGIELFENFGGNTESGMKIRANVSGLSIIPKFIIIAFIFIFCFVCILIGFAILGNITSTNFDNRNVQFDYVQRMSCMIRRVHLWTVELLYREDTLFENYEIIEGIETELEKLQEYDVMLRFGCPEMGLVGIDKISGAFEIYYETHCEEQPLMEGATSEELYEHLYCSPMNRQIGLFVEATEKLIRLAEAGNYTNEANIELRGSQWYDIIIQSDNNVYDHGVIHNYLDELGETVKHSVDGLLESINNFAWIMLVIGLPAYVILFALLFLSYPKAIKENIIQTKKLMMLLPKKTLMKSEIYWYIIGQSGFSNLFDISKKARMEECLTSFNQLNYPMIHFGKNLVTLFYNNAAGNLFGLGKSSGVNILTLFNPESSQKLEQWCRSGSGDTKKMSCELTATYDGQEFKVLVDIGKTDGKFWAIIENVESSKKKEIFAAAEIRSEKITKLVENMLPKQIAKQMNEKDLGRSITRIHDNVTAIFADICDFTRISKDMGPEQIIKVLNEIFTGIDDLTEKHRIEKIKTIGDCYFGVAGIPNYVPLHVQYAMAFAIDVLQLVHDYRAKTKIDIHLRIGIASGKVIAGVIGKIKWCYDVWGDPINLAARLEEHGKPDKIMISQDSYASLFDKYKFIETTVTPQGLDKIKAYLHSPKLKEYVPEKEKINPPKDERTQVIEVIDKDDPKIINVLPMIPSGQKYRLSGESMEAVKEENMDEEERKEEIPEYKTEIRTEKQHSGVSMDSDVSKMIEQHGLGDQKKKRKKK